jgi:hypothetical protein
LCKKAPARPFAAYAVKEYFFSAAFSTILLRKISENSVGSKLSFTAVGGKILFTQPQDIFFKAPISFILLSKMNEIGALKSFILPFRPKRV